MSEPIKLMHLVLPLKEAKLLLKYYETLKQQARWRRANQNDS